MSEQQKPAERVAAAMGWGILVAEQWLKKNQNALADIQKAQTAGDVARVISGTAPATDPVITGRTMQGGERGTLRTDHADKAKASPPVPEEPAE